MENIDERIVGLGRNQFGYLTKNRRFLLKTISQEHYRKLNSFIEFYVKRMINKDSFLIKIFGIFTMNLDKNLSIYFIIIENKGYQLINPKEGILINNKDRENYFFSGVYDHVKIPPDFQVELSKFMYNKIENVLKSDIKTLSKIRGIDYSLKIIYGDIDEEYSDFDDNFIEIDDNIAYLEIDCIFMELKSSRSLDSKYRKEFLKIFSETFIKSK